jgi:hypothetical protein
MTNVGVQVRLEGLYMYQGALLQIVHAFLDREWDTRIKIINTVFSTFVFEAFVSLCKNYQKVPFKSRRYFFEIGQNGCSKTRIYADFRSERKFLKKYLKNCFFDTISNSPEKHSFF